MHPSFLFIAALSTLVIACGRITEFSLKEFAIIEHGSAIADDITFIFTANRFPDTICDSAGGSFPVACDGGNPTFSWDGTTLDIEVQPCGDGLGREVGNVVITELQCYPARTGTVCMPPDGEVEGVLTGFP